MENNNNNNNFSIIRNALDSGVHQDPARASFYVGLGFLQGAGVSSDFDLSIRYLKQSSALGNVDAQKILACLLNSSSTSDLHNRRLGFHLFDSLYVNNDYSGQSTSCTSIDVYALEYLAGVYEYGDNQLGIECNLEISLNLYWKASTIHYSLTSIHHLLSRLFQSATIFTDGDEDEEDEEKYEFRAQKVFKLLDIGIEMYSDVKCAMIKVEFLSNGAHMEPLFVYTPTEDDIHEAQVIKERYNLNKTTNYPSISYISENKPSKDVANKQRKRVSVFDSLLKQVGNLDKLDKDEQSSLLDAIRLALTLAPSGNSVLDLISSVISSIPRKHLQTSTETVEWLINVLDEHSNCNIIQAEYMICNLFENYPTDGYSDDYEEFLMLHYDRASREFFERFEPFLDTSSLYTQSSDTNQSHSYTCEIEWRLGILSVRRMQELLSQQGDLIETIVYSLKAAERGDLFSYERALEYIERALKNPSISNGSIVSVLEEFGITNDESSTQN